MSLLSGGVTAWQASLRLPCRLDLLTGPGAFYDELHQPSQAQPLLRPICETLILRPNPERKERDEVQRRVDQIRLSRCVPLSTTTKKRPVPVVKTSRARCRSLRRATHTRHIHRERLTHTHTRSLARSLALAHRQPTRQILTGAGDRAKANTQRKQLDTTTACQKDPHQSSFPKHYTIRVFVPSSSPCRRSFDHI